MSSIQNLTPAPEPHPRDPGRVRIVELTADDAPTVRTIMQSAFAEYITPDFSYGTERETDASIAEELRTGGHAIAVLEEDVPVAIAKYFPEEGTGLLYFWRVSVLPSRRGRGHADRMIEWITATARAEGYDGIACNVVPRHRGLVAVYARHHMADLGEVTVSPRSGTGDDVTLVRLERRWRPAHEVRELGPDDAGVLRDVLQDAFAQYDRTEAPSGAMLETVESLREDLSGRLRAVAVIAEGRVVAAMKLRATRDRALEMSRVAVLVDERGRGWARVLVGWAYAEAQRLGLRSVGCTVRAEEAGLIALYEHLGLAVTARGVHQSLTGRPHEVVQMRGRVVDGAHTELSSAR